MNETDKALYVRMGLRERLSPDRKEGIRQGGRASTYDINLTGHRGVFEHMGEMLDTRAPRGL